jgi:large subunit ribosomal protein L54
MPGLNYLKDQPSVVALPDEAYPDWLWKILLPKEFPPEEQGPGGAAERYRLRRENKERIKAQNFMKTQ